MLYFTVCSSDLHHKQYIGKQALIANDFDKGLVDIVKTTCCYAIVRHRDSSRQKVLWGNLLHPQEDIGNGQKKTEDEDTINS